MQKRRDRNDLGQRLREYRQEAKVTQKQLAKRLGLEYYTMISQMELGYIAIPSTLWPGIAVALGVPVSAWVLDCLKDIQPDTYKALFGSRSHEENVKLLELYHSGALDQYIREHLTR